MNAPALKLVDPFGESNPSAFDLYGYCGDIAESADLSADMRTALDSFNRKADMLPLDAHGEQRAAAIKNLAMFGIDKGLAPAEILRGCEYAARTTGYMLTEATIKDAVQRAIKSRMGVIDTDPDKVQSGRRFKLQSFKDIQAELNHVWLIADLLASASVALLYAKPNEAKTFIALAMCFAVARGEPWHDLPTERGAVLYLATEGRLANRVQAYREHHDLHDADIPFYLIQDSAILAAAQGDADPLTAAAQDASILSRQAVRLIVIDTLNQVMGGANENDAADMGLLLASIAKVQRATGATVLIVHHAGKDESRGARGHSSLLAAVDTALEIRDGTLTVEKQRDGERGARYGFRLVPISLGTDTRGKAVTSCVVEPISASAAHAFKGRQVKPGSVAADALATIEDMAMNAPGKPVLLSAWQSEFTKRHYPNATKHTANKAFLRARAALLKAGRITTEGEYVSTID